MVRLLLVDDHAAFRQPLAFLLAREPDVQVVREAGTLTEARRHLSEVDLALIDENLPDGNGLDLIQALHASNPQSRILLLTDRADLASAERAQESGADTVLDKSVSLADILHSTRILARTSQTNDRPGRQT